MVNALARYGIRINVINPASNCTGRVHRALRLDAKERDITEAEALKRREAEIPMGRYGRPSKLRTVPLSERRVISRARSFRWMTGSRR